MAFITITASSSCFITPLFATHTLYAILHITLSFSQPLTTPIVHTPPLLARHCYDTRHCRRHTLAILLLCRLRFIAIISCLFAPLRRFIYTTYAYYENIFHLLLIFVCLLFIAITLLPSCVTPLSWAIGFAYFAAAILLSLPWSREHTPHYDITWLLLRYHYHYCHWAHIITATVIIITHYAVGGTPLRHAMAMAPY